MPKSEAEKKAEAFDFMAQDFARAQKLLDSTPHHLGKRLMQGLCDEVESLRKLLRNKPLH